MKTRISCLLLLVSALFSVNASAESAFVIKGDLCFAAVDLGEGLVNLPLGNKLHANARDAGTDVFPGNGKFTCQGLHPFDLDRALVFRNVCFVPDTPFGDLITEDTILVLTPSGGWTLQCNFKKPK
jgi:hypothetical protein